MEARLDDDQALVERDQRVVEAAAHTEEDVLVRRDVALDLAADAAAEDLEAADDLLPAPVRGRGCVLERRRRRVQHGDACDALCGPVWSWFLSPQPQPGFSGSTTGGGVGGV